MAVYKKKRDLSLPADNFTFGKANRPQTPINGIICNDFGETSAQALQSRYAELKNFRKELRSPKNEIRYTKAKLKADEHVKAQATSSLEAGFGMRSNDFKLRRFQNIESKIDHRR